MLLYVTLELQESFKSYRHVREKQVFVSSDWPYRHEDPISSRVEIL